MTFTDPIDLLRKGKILKVSVPHECPECVLVWSGELKGGESISLRIHSSCLFGEAFGAGDCECGLQLEAFLDFICEQGGLLIYSYEEGRGEGIETKCRAIALQQTNGWDTSAAFNSLGLPPDGRSYDRSVSILRSLEVPIKIKLASNNPRKMAALERAGFIVERMLLNVEKDDHQTTYVREKENCLGHLPSK